MAGLRTFRRKWARKPDLPGSPWTMPGGRQPRSSHTIDAHAGKAGNLAGRIRLVQVVAVDDQVRDKSFAGLQVVVLSQGIGTVKQRQNLVSP
jgi:hypothetical protein